MYNCTGRRIAIWDAATILLDMDLIRHFDHDAFCARRRFGRATHAGWWPGAGARGGVLGYSWMLAYTYEPRLDRDGSRIGETEASHFGSTGARDLVCVLETRELCGSSGRRASKALIFNCSC